ncbi:sedoheptulose-bisphosphatase [Ascoidea rubescens DSM 1968]|uniref:Phosphoglycerate mutase-like protein n=1 Tax=Ascoidea rubescens DSM 1968 TaxID=1344418 RepID=A0A1D2V9T1_9ASCO|nr:phosphoglycerate mutase-like protein [Ascoidea rubescens DSM 1968]ODV58400.1 phosphoglycerate mutase-like protein [Ascoidea rubescens DSM 1968]
MPSTPTPRVIFIRHGQTAWSKSGQYTSFTDLSLTDYGVKQMKATGKAVVNTIILPENVTKIICSPRKRAKESIDIIMDYISESEKSHIVFEVNENIREWEYGDYEGLLTKEIIQLRKSRGLDDGGKTIWNIWEHGCENGESAIEVETRLKNLAQEIREIHAIAFKEKKPCDIIVVAHGHILRSFTNVWLGKPINRNPQYILNSGGIGVLSYQHNDINEPALELAGAFYVPVEEEAQHTIN